MGLYGPGGDAVERAPVGGGRALYGPAPRILSWPAAGWVVEAAALRAALTAVDEDLAAHLVATTAIHGITDTGLLVITTDPRLSDPRVPVDGSVTEVKLGIGVIMTVDWARYARPHRPGRSRQRSLYLPVPARDRLRTPAVPHQLPGRRERRRVLVRLDVRHPPPSAQVAQWNLV